MREALSFDYQISCSKNVRSWDGKGQENWRKSKYAQEVDNTLSYLTLEGPSMMKFHEIPSELSLEETPLSENRATS